MTIKFLRVIFISFIALFICSCEKIDLVEIENQLNDSDNTVEIISEPISCSTVSLPDKFLSGSFSAQGSDGVCTYIVDRVEFSPNELDFSNTDFCEFQYAESSTIHRMTVDYSDPENPTCTLSSSGGVGIISIL